MVGALHDAKITGSMAGRKRAVLQAAKAPTGKKHGMRSRAWSENLGAKHPANIYHSERNAQASFEKNRLGTCQQAEYAENYFREEASSAAAVRDCRLEPESWTNNRCV